MPKKKNHVSSSSYLQQYVHLRYGYATIHGDDNESNRANKRRPGCWSLSVMYGLVVGGAGEGAHEMHIFFLSSFAAVVGGPTIRDYDRLRSTDRRGFNDHRRPPVDRPVHLLRIPSSRPHAYAPYFCLRSLVDRRIPTPPHPPPNYLLRSRLVRFVRFCWSIKYRNNLNIINFFSRAS